MLHEWNTNINMWFIPGSESVKEDNSVLAIIIIIMITVNRAYSPVIRIKSFRCAIF